MLMGKVVSKRTYEFYEYIVAVLISLGMMAFLFGKVYKIDGWIDRQTDKSER